MKTIRTIVAILILAGVTIVGFHINGITQKSLIGFVAGFVLVPLWFCFDPFIHEPGHALCLRMFDGTSTLTIKVPFIKNLSFTFLKIQVCLTNKKEFQHFTFSIYDYKNLTNNQIRLTSFAGIFNSIVGLILFSILAYNINAWGFSFAPILFIVITLDCLLSKNSTNDFIILFKPEKLKKLYNELSDDDCRKYNYALIKLNLESDKEIIL